MTDSSTGHSGCSGCESAADVPGYTSWRGHFSLGLWQNNIALVQLLGLCPVMAVTTSATNGLGMGMATCAVMVLANLLVSLLRNWIPAEVRNPMMIVLIAGTVTLVDLLMNAWLHDLYQVLGLFIALIVTNCAVLGRTESFAIRNSTVPSVLDGLGMGLGFTWALVLLGGVREILGSGTLFAQASLLLGPGFHWLEIRLLPEDAGVLLVLLPPGGFIALGLLIALKRLVDERVAQRRNPMPETALAGLT